MNLRKVSLYGSVKEHFIQCFIQKGNNMYYKRIVIKDILASFLVSVKISWESTYQTNDACESYNNFHNSLNVAINKSFSFIENETKSY